MEGFVEPEENDWKELFELQEKDEEQEEQFLKIIIRQEIIIYPDGQKIIAHLKKEAKWAKKNNTIDISIFIIFYMCHIYNK